MEKSQHNPQAASVPLSGKAQESTILYEDDACLVIDKPVGIAVQPGAGMAENERTVLDLARELFAERGLPFSEGHVLAHRLDKETSGCLLLAKNPEAHAALQKQFADRTVTKTYLALVAGIPSPAEATIDAPIGRSIGNKTKMSVARNIGRRESQTTYHTLSTGDNCALLACDLHTGRTHQIRVHLAAIHHPILGDTKYTSTLSRALTKKFGIERLCLHAWKLACTSPQTGETVDVESPRPAFTTPPYT